MSDLFLADWSALRDELFWEALPFFTISAGRQFDIMTDYISLKKQCESLRTTFSLYWPGFMYFEITNCLLWMLFYLLFCSHHGCHLFKSPSAYQSQLLITFYPDLSQPKSSKLIRCHPKSNVGYIAKQFFCVFHWFVITVTGHIYQVKPSHPKSSQASRWSYQ